MSRLGAVAVLSHVGDTTVSELTGRVDGGVTVGSERPGGGVSGPWGGGRGTGVANVGRGRGQLLSLLLTAVVRSRTHRTPLTTDELQSAHTQ